MDYLVKHDRGDHSAAAARRFGARVAGWTRDERLAWSRWAPLLLAVKGVEGWTAAERRAASGGPREGGRRESDFVRLRPPEAHAAILRMAQGSDR
jgi:hypothetical protein